MWRAFFFAIGTMLIILGLECLVTGQFVVADGSRAKAILARLLDSDHSAKDQPASIQPGLASNQQGGAGFGSPQTVSSFGPSRFDSSPFDAQYQPRTSYYGGRPNSTSTQKPNSQFSLAGFGTPTRPPIAPMPQPTASLKKNSATRVITPKEWVPWSLLAAGTLVVLYTNSTSQRYSND